MKASRHPGQSFVHLRNPHRAATILALLMMAVIFLIDLVTPLSIAIGILYVVPVIYSLKRAHALTTWALAGIAVILIFEGYYWSPPGGEQWQVLGDRLFSGLAVLAVAALGTALIRAIRRAAAEERSNEILRQASRNKSEFIANLTHEMRGPLSAIAGYADLFEAQVDAGDRDVAEFVTRIRNNCNHLLAMTNDYLDIAMIEAGTLVSIKKDCDLFEEIAVVRSVVENRARAKGLQLYTRIPPEFPRYLRTDAQRVRQMLINLLGNAVKFTHAGSVELTVEARRLKGQKIELFFRVKDTGIGIAPEHQAKLFSRFSQAHEHKDNSYGGCGLGLSLSRQLAMTLGGDLILEQSIPGKGSAFLLRLPAEICVTPQTEERPETKKPDQALTHVEDDILKRSSVLLVEDADDVASLYRVLLEKHRVRVDVVESGTEAMQKAQSGRYSAILMDLHLPDMDGLEAARKIKRKGVDTPVIGFSADCRYKKHAAWKELGLDGFLLKPATESDLCRHVIDAYRQQHR